VTWHFEATTGRAHEFTLSYRVRGVTVPEQAADLFTWTVLPVDHDYRIASSEMTLELPAGAELVGTPTIELWRMAEPDVRVGEPTIDVSAKSLDHDASYAVALRAGRGSLANAPPAWRARELQVEENGLVAIALAAALTFGALLVLGFAWLNSPRLAAGTTDRHRVEQSPPSDLSPALASALVTNGSPGPGSLVATLVDLARRGAVTIVETQPGSRWRSPSYALAGGAAGALEAHEREFLKRVFQDRAGGQVDLKDGIKRAWRGHDSYAHTVRAELERLRFISPERVHGKRRLVIVSTVLLGMALVAIAVAIAFADAAGGRAFLPALGLGVVAALGYILSSALSRLSDEGARVASRWRAFAQHLKNVSKDKSAASPGQLDEWFPYAVGVGLGLPWAKRRASAVGRAPAPAWLVPLLRDKGTNGALAVVLFTSGANAGAGAGGVGGAAGGGSSGAS
jgi:hypothetical protein